MVDKMAVEKGDLWEVTRVETMVKTKAVIKADGKVKTKDV